MQCLDPDPVNNCWLLQEHGQRVLLDGAGRFLRCTINHTSQRKNCRTNGRTSKVWHISETAMPDKASHFKITEVSCSSFVESDTRPFENQCGVFLGVQV